MAVMRFGTILLVAAAASTSASLTTHSDQIPIGPDRDGFEAVRKALRSADIIGEVLDDFQPKCFVAPSYGENNKAVILGNKFKQSVTQQRPVLKIYCPGLESSPGLTIALTDPDAKSREDPKWSEMCHWISIVPTSNQTATELSTLFDFSEESHDPDLVEYKPPGPPPRTGYHRYVFVLLEGDNSNLTAPEERQHWGTGKVRHGVRDWAQREGLEVVGANFFIERNEKQ